MTKWLGFSDLPPLFLPAVFKHVLSFPLLGVLQHWQDWFLVMARWLVHGRIFGSISTLYQQHRYYPQWWQPKWYHHFQVCFKGEVNSLPGSNCSNSEYCPVSSLSSSFSTQCECPLRIDPLLVSTRRHVSSGTNLLLCASLSHWLFSECLTTCTRSVLISPGSVH